MGFFEKLKQGLSKTASSISSVFTASELDDDFYDDLEESLIVSDLGMDTTETVMDRLRQTVREQHIKTVDEAKIALRAILADMLNVGDSGLRLDTKPSVILVIGVNGVGKTTSIGKLAARYVNEGKKVMLSAADTFRAAAADQLEIWAKRAGADIVRHGEGADPAAVVFDSISAAKARGSDIIIVDTAGRLHNKANLMNELGKISRIIDRELPNADKEVLLVLDGTTGQNGLLQAKRLGYELGRYGAIVVSGGAAGIDTLALRGAVSSGTPPVAVFACGVDVDYPAANRSLFEDLRTNGCVMSELPPGTPPLPEHFPSRNRILSGLALGSVVVEAPKKSGALITARHALEQGRDVFTLPGNLGNPTCAGNIQLLKQGAILVEEGWDILQEYTYLYPELPQRQRPAGPMTLTAQEAAGSVVVAETAAAPEKTDTKAVDKQENRAYIDVQEILPQVSPDEVAVLRLLEDGKQPVDRLIDETQLPAGRILSALTLLEVKGYVKRLPARYYELAKK